MTTVSMKIHVKEHGSVSPTMKNSHELLDRYAREALVLLLFCAAAASVLNIFMQTRGFEDGNPRFGLAAMLDEDAERPFVKRQLLPMLANQVERLVPVYEQAQFVKYHLDRFHLKQRYFDNPRYANLQEQAWTPGYSIRYHFIYGAIFASLLLTLYLLRILTVEVTGSRAALAGILPALFALLLPMTFMHGGFYYDFSELFFFSALLLAALKANYLAWLIVLPLATLNKETAILLPLVYSPIIFRNCRSTLARGAMLLSVVSSVFVFYYTSEKYSINQGEEVLFHLQQNIEFWLNPANYFLWHDFYAAGVPFPRGANVIVLIALFPIFHKGWKIFPDYLKQILILSFAINFSLFLLYGYRDEIRALSMTFILIYLLVAVSVLGRDADAGLKLPK